MENQTSLRYSTVPVPYQYRTGTVPWPLHSTDLLINIIDDCIAFKRQLINGTCNTMPYSGE